MCRIKASTISYMLMRLGNWPAIRAISSSTGTDPNARLLPLPAGPVSINAPKRQIKTITTDNGPEFAAHKMITEYLGTIVYFADPYASWQKGAIENTNKLIRQYIPKKANFDDFTDKKIANIQKKINRRPRQKLNFKTPKSEFYRKI